MNAIEKIEVDNKDRPIEDIIIQGAHIFVDPYQEVDEQLVLERAAEIERLAQEAAKDNAKSNKKSDGTLKVYRSGVGKYVVKDEERQVY